MQHFLFVLLVLVASSGCLRSTTVISVRADGSGTLVQETGMNAQTVAMLKGATAGVSEPRAGSPLELFGEGQARKAADTMGVQFVSGEPIKTANLEGYRAQYAFDDIRKLRMKMNQDPSTTLSDAPASEPPFTFGFERRGGSSLLTITVPEHTPASGPLGQLAGPPTGGSPGSPGSAQANPQALQMMRMMLQGLFVDISLAVDGPILKTNAPHVDGSRVTLLQLDFDKVLADDGALQTLQGATDLKALSAVPGLKVVTDRQVTIEFGR